MKNFGSDDKRELIEWMIQLLKADGKESSREWAYVNEVANQYDLEISSAVQSASTINLAVPDHDRMVLFYYLLFLSKIDGEVDDQEVLLLRDFALRLGFRPAMADDFAGVLRAYSGQQVPTEEMIGVIRKYLN